MGMEVKGKTGARIRRALPGGGLPSPFPQFALPWDDDLSMTYVLAAFLAEAGSEIDPKKLADRYVDWFKREPRGISPLVAEVLDLTSKGSIAPPAERIWHQRGGSAGESADNGAIARITPVGIRFRGDPQAVCRNALADARLTHWEPICQWTTVAFAVVLADTLEDRVTPLELFLPAHGCPPDVAKRVLEEPPLDIERARVDKGDQQNTIHAWRMALWASFVAKDFQHSIERLLRCGGATDANGAVCGAILGARFGCKEIPEAWRAAVSDLAQIESVADRLYRLGIPARASTAER